MSRRALIEGLSRLGMMLLTLLVSPASEASPSSSPNIIIVLADDLGWMDVGYHGSEIKTPVLDRLASEGVVFTQFHAQPTCSPTRAALLTGQSPQRFGITQPLSKLQPRGLSLATQTLADHLKTAGYQTFLTGKWHLGPSDYAYHPKARGFDHFYGNLTGGVGHWDHVHGGGLDWQRNGYSVREKGYTSHLLAAEAQHLIRTRQRNQPFFLYLSFNAPHLPNEAPSEALEPYQSIENPYRRAHAAMVSELDSALGTVLQTVEEEGLSQDTLIWFMSDNGGLLAEDGPPPLVTFAKILDWVFEGPVPQRTLEFIRVNMLEGGSDNGRLRSGKASIYEGGVRVPALLHWRGQLSPARRDELVTVQDVTPTLLALAGVETAASFDGRSLWPALKEGLSIAPSDYVTVGREGKAFYRWPWKLIVAHEGGSVELYHLEEDPLEAADLSAQAPERVRVLKQALAKAPQGESIHLPLTQVLRDMDFFGGEEDRPPWAEQMRYGSPEALRNGKSAHERGSSK